MLSLLSSEERKLSTIKMYKKHYSPQTHQSLRSVITKNRSERTEEIDFEGWNSRTNNTQKTLFAPNLAAILLDDLI